MLVLERNPHPGGTAYSYRRKGFSFPMGPLGFGNPDMVQNILKEAGVNERLDLKRVYYQLRAFGIRAPLSLPYHEMITELVSIFPEEETGIWNFFNDVEGNSFLLEGPGEGPAGEACDSTSAADYLSDLIHDWRLRRILGSMGTREPYSGLYLLAAMWRLLGEKGIHYPSRGMRHMCDTLAAPLSDPAGPGELALGTEVSGIVTRRGRARGVVLPDGTRLEAGAVIPNADYKATFLRLVHPGAIPGEFLRAVSRARQTASNLQVSLGLDASRVDLPAFEQASRLIYRREEASGPGYGPKPAWEKKEVTPTTWPPKSWR